MHLAPADREAIILVTVQELGYAGAAAVCGCPVGTLKSRVSRARLQLRALLSGPNDGALATARPQGPSSRRRDRAPHST
jgi:RNA polymerase sigma-70 factor (ECF subfamily)